MYIYIVSYAYMGSIFQNESFFHMWASFPYVVHFSHIRVFFRE